MVKKKTSDFIKNDEVLYIPSHLMQEALETGDGSLLSKKENLGTVTSTNKRFVFVRYLDTTNSKATSPEDLFFIKDRPDLQEILRGDVGDVWINMKMSA